MLGNYCRNLGNYVCQGLTLRLARSGIKPWMMNLCCVTTAIGSGYFFFSGKIGLALILLFFSGVFDYLDGAITRVLLSWGRSSSCQGALFHILADKVSEVAIFVGMSAGELIGWDLGLLAISTCLILTLFGRYVQHKELFDLEHSLFDRADRFVVLLMFCLLGYFKLAAIVVSTLNIAGLIQRIYVSIKAKTYSKADVWIL